jgi:hypothetical protein
MENELNKDNLKGALFQNFEEEVVNAPEIVWDNIEKELFSQKKKTAFLWFSSFLVFSLLSVGGFFLFYQKPSEKQRIVKSQTKVVSEDKNRSNLNVASAKNNSIDKISKEKGNNEINTNNSLIQKSEKQFSKNETKTNQVDKNQIVNSINSLENQKIETKIINESQASTSIDSNRQEIQLFRFPYLKPIISGSILALKTMLDSPKSKDCTSNISLQLTENRGINVRSIDGQFDSQSMKSKTVGEKKIPTRLRLHQFGVNFKINEKIDINTGFQFGKSEFQSRWFYRQFYFENGETTVELKTLNGEATLDNEEIVTEIATGDTVLYKLRANYSSSFFSLPIGFSYNFNQNRLSPFIRYAVSLDFHQSPTISLDIQKNGALNNYDLKFQNNTIRFALQQITSVGFDYKINKNWSAILESKLAIPVSKINVGTNYKLKSSYLTLGLGIKYTLPCTNQKPKK